MARVAVGLKVIALAFYHIALVGGGIFVAFYADFFHHGSPWTHVGFWGLLGCACYCTKSLYFQFCVRKEWDDRWVVWHIIRPFVGTALGAASYLFVQSGLLLIEAEGKESGEFYGIYAIAFIAGFNVDNFLKKIEETSFTLWKIKKTRMSQQCDMKRSQTDKTER